MPHCRGRKVVAEHYLSFIETSAMVMTFVLVDTELYNVATESFLI